MAENQVGVKIRAMTGAHHTEEDAGHQQTPADPEIVPDQAHHEQNTDTTKNPTVQLTRIDTDNMEEFVRNHSDIGLECYVPNLVNTHVRELIRNRVQINPGENKIVFNSAELSEFFTRSCYELDLQTGRVSTPAEDIGVQCQQDEFDLILLREHFQKYLDQMEAPTDELKRIPLVKKRAPMAEIMDMNEIEEKMQRYCQLWVLYTKLWVLYTQASCELTRRSKILQEEAAKACKVYGPYIRDVLQQVEEVMTLFVMEKELRNIKGRGHFPIPTITPHNTKIENHQQSRKTLEAVDKKLIRILNAVKESGNTYEKEQEAARQHARAARPTHRTQYNFTSLNCSTPIKNMGTTENRHQPTERTTHFNPNPTHHFYPLTELIGCTNRYELPINDSIINGAGTTPGVQFTTGMTDVAGCNEPWRNNGTGTIPQQHTLPPHMTNPTDCNGFFSNSPNSSNNRN